MIASNPHESPEMVIEGLTIGICRGNIRKEITMCKNDSLKDIQFYKVFDSFAAYQEISMWIGGVLSNTGNDMAEISDERMAKKKGFDHPYSFKKEPKRKK